MGIETSGNGARPDPIKQRVIEIAHEHIWYAAHHSDRVAEIAKELGISTQSALALAIADQIMDEFLLTYK